MIKLSYDFDDNSSFEYEVDPKDYFKTFSDADICELGKEIYNTLTEAEKQEIMADFGKDVVEFNPDNELSVELARNLVEESDVDELAGEYIESMKDYYYDDARTEYEDYIAYSTDKYGYYGVSERDFY